MRKLMAAVMVAAGLAACGGSGGYDFSAGFDTTDADAGADAPHAVTLVRVDADASMATVTPDAGSPDSSRAAFDAAPAKVEPPDASADSSTDAADGAVDVADAEAGVDAAMPPPPPPPPPPFCPGGDGSLRCSNYQQQVCGEAAKTWTWNTGDQSCCFDPGGRFTVVGTTVVDSVTGTTWYRYGGKGSLGGASPLCAAVIPGGRLPTVTELMSVRIGVPIAIGGRLFSVCDPPVDQHAFQNVSSDVMWTSDGACVDMLRGTVVANCLNADAFMCVGQ